MTDGLFSQPNIHAKLAHALEISHAHWTDSTPVDSSSHQEVLPPETLAALGIEVVETGGVRHVTAGLMHTYGYLLSHLQTPYGLKSKRWLESRLDERLGLPAGLFGPSTREGEFLSNVTAVFFRLARITTRVAGAAKPRARAKRDGVIVEHVLWTAPDGSRIRKTIRTHVVKLLDVTGAPKSDVALLIYEVDRRLVTGFPIDAHTVAELMAVGPAVDTVFHPRYNLFVDPRWKVLEHRNEGFSADAK